MAIQVGFSSPTLGTTVPTAIADGSNLPPGAPIVRDAPRSRQAEPGGKQMPNHAPSTTKKVLAAACGLALGLGSLGLFASAGTAAADGLCSSTLPTTCWDHTPMPPAVIDEDGFHNYRTSSYPADPTWPSPPSWGSYPADPTWPGDSSHPCCSR